MDQKINKACEGCGSPFLVLVHSEETENVYKCEYCGRPLYQSKDGSLRNPEIKKCENCGQINGPGTRVCQRCGTQIRYECPNCGSLVDLTATYCPYCEIHLQNYLEEQKRIQAEEKRAAGVRKIQKLESEIQSLQSSIDSNEGNIRQARRKIDTIRKSSRKLYYFGKAGLSEEEKSIYTQASASIGCGTKVIALILAITGMNLSWQLFIGLAGTHFNYFVPSTFFQNERSV